MKLVKTAAVSLLCFSLGACGFRPIYATSNGASPVSSQIYVSRIAAPENVLPYLEDALNTRIVSADGVTPRYELVIQANESADRLAVQIDATVTRYNYRLRARYWVIDHETGKRVRGTARAITSYNIVNSQYSTLFAEKAAVEKAARELAEEIERDMLVRFSQPADERNDIDEEEFEAILKPEEILPERRGGRVADPVIEPPEEIIRIISDETDDGAVTDPDASSDAATDAGSGTSSDSEPLAVPDPVIDGRP